MVENIKQGLPKDVDVYYATAGFGSGTTAEATNAVAKRELYIDVDCGDRKPYSNKTEAMQALKEFCKKVKLPKPTIVDSGNGYHAHWIFTDAVPVHQWTEAAERLKALCKVERFSVDGGCTADVVRVLRIPDTINQKNGAQVVLLTDVVHYSFDKLAGVLNNVAVPPTPVATVSRPKLSNITKTLAGWDNRISKFETIWIKSSKGQGCAQIAEAIKHPENVTEPCWRGVLSIAEQCDDRDWAIHEVSKGHPDYSPEETERKAALTKGPYTCETFQSLDRPELCVGCPHGGKITSPIQLGATIALQRVEEKPFVEAGGRRYDIPAYPWPYLRGKHGGVYMVKHKEKSGDDDGDTPEEYELVYPHDLYIYKRMRDSELGDVLWLRHHLPNDGVRDFMMSQKEFAAPEKLRDKLNEQGVTTYNQKQLQQLQHYFARSIQDLQLSTKADAIHARFGWTKHNTFIAGDREYTDKGVKYTPAARSLDRYLDWFRPKGTLEGWKRVVDMYNRPECDLHAYGLLTGFGSMLMHFSPENGGVLNYFSKKSGTGKTTILKMINSIFANPSAMMKDAQDTHLSKVHRMGVLNGIAMTLDEMTNTKPEEMSVLLYGSTQGRARDRMKAGENAERHNDVTWKGNSIWSSNTSIEDRLGIIKFDPQGEMARVIEIHLRTPVPDDVLGAQKVFNQLEDNYGHAGPLFISFVVSNIEYVQRVWEQTRDWVYLEHTWTQTERYKLNQVVCALAAGVITNTLELTSFNISRIAAHILAVVKKSGADMQSQSTRAVETFAAFINNNINNMLTIDSKQRSNGLQNEPYMKPKGRLVVRYEPDTKTLFIVQKDFTRWCADNYINAKEIRVLFNEETGREVELIKKRMGAGWDTDFGPVSAYCIKDAAQVLGLTDDATAASSTETA